MGRLERIISGGQTGADQAGWRAAKAAGLETGGWMPKGWLTQDGPRPAFAALYGACEHESAGYAARTQRNVLESDATLWFGDPETSGGACTLSACRAFGKPHLVILLDSTPVFPSRVAAWIEAHGVRTLNVAGNREGDQPGIGARVETFLGQVFALLGERRA